MSFVPNFIKIGQLVRKFKRRTPTDGTAISILQPVQNDRCIYCMPNFLEKRTLRVGPTGWKKRAWVRARKKKKECWGWASPRSREADMLAPDRAQGHGPNNQHVVLNRVWWYPWWGCFHFAPGGIRRDHLLAKIWMLTYTGVVKNGFRNGMWLLEYQAYAWRDVLLLKVAQWISRYSGLPGAWNCRTCHSVKWLSLRVTGGNLPAVSA
jgi:hypothetical protein